MPQVMQSADFVLRDIKKTIQIALQRLLPEITNAALLSLSNGCKHCWHTSTCIKRNSCECNRKMPKGHFIYYSNLSLALAKLVVKILKRFERIFSRNSEHRFGQCTKNPKRKRLKVLFAIFFNSELQPTHSRISFKGSVKTWLRMLKLKETMNFQYFWGKKILFWLSISMIVSNGTTISWLELKT